MDHSIIPRSAICAKAQAAFARGAGRDEHGFNWHAAAVPTWQAEWDRCAAATRGFNLAEGVGP
jgi:hypothetical protein